MAPTNLQSVRAKSAVDAAAIENLLRDPAQRVIRNKVLPVLASDPVFDKTRKPFLNHAQGILDSLKLSRHLLETRDRQGWSREEYLHALLSIDETIPLAMSENAFVNVIESQGSEEQRAFWIPKCRTYEVVGCYAQTELAHGSNVQGLETTAKYDPKTQEFVIDSGSEDNMKFWIGAMGVTANHALVQAILQVPNPKNPSTHISVGPHLFLVPIRDSHTHLPLPGIKVGDIGPKAYSGFRVLDNGYLHLTSVRIPRTNMLMRHSTVSPDGTFRPAKHSKLSYGSMVALRAGIPMTAGWSLARGVTIAIRYCIHRTQFSSSPGAPENSVIDYASTRHRLYPLLATSYAYILAGKELLALYHRMMAGLAKGDVSLLAEVHSLSTALKAKSTWDCNAGLEEARKSIGGHGYSHLAGVGAIFAQNTPSQTFEGDNYVISQQIARSLIKEFVELRKNPSKVLPDSFGYLRNLIDTKFSPVQRGQRVNWLDPAQQSAALELRAAKIIEELATTLAKNPKTPWTELSWTSARLAAAHADIYTVSAFRSFLAANKNKDLEPMLRIFTLTILLKALPELVEAGVETAGLRKAQEEAVDKVSKEDAVGLTDGFGFYDWELQGVVGRKEGNVYEDMRKVVEEWDVSKGELGGELRQAALAITGYERSKKTGSKL